MQLRAGILSMMYEDGFLRYISAGKEEVLKMIYFAVRDTAWDTIPSVIADEQIMHNDDSFTITYQRSFDHAGIQMHWHVRIEGNATSEIHFEINGRALSTFQKNRAGICILHPIKECMGREVLLTHTDNSTEKNSFPVYISPHQPFKDLRAMQWPATDRHTGKLYFKGEIFETEDQRNWTDDSFKTYCTPLELPFPVWMHTGDEVHQSVRFSLTPAPLPAIGIGRSAIRNANYLAGLERLSEIGFTHYRTEIRPADSDWSQTLKDSLKESQVLHASLEIVLTLTNDDQLNKFLDLAIEANQISSIILLPAPGSYLTPLKKAFPNTRIGSGTDSHFTELNRSGIPTEGLDFVSYAIHPQVHAFDDMTLMENAGAQGYTVDTARHKYGLPVHISSITLHDPRITDPRLHTDFGAQWTAASLKALTTAGAASITYFEALGKRGVAAFDTTFTPFPVLDLFREIAKPRPI